MSVWPDEVIKAQAVAARSYALYKMQHSDKAYALLATDRELPYEGTGKRIEKEAVTKLIQATKGQYLVDAYGRAIEAVTTSSSGGRNRKRVESARYCRKLSAVGRGLRQRQPGTTWESRIAPALLESLAAQRGYTTGKPDESIRLSPLDDAVLTERPGRVKYIILSGEAGAVKISGSELQDLLKNSTLFDIETGTPVPEALKVPIEDHYGMEIGSKDIGIKVNGVEKARLEKFSAQLPFAGRRQGEENYFPRQGQRLRPRFECLGCARHGEC